VITPKNECVDFSNIYSKTAGLRICFKFDLVYLVIVKFFAIKIFVCMKMTFLYHGLLAFVVREPLLPLHLQDLLDHDNG